VSALGECRKYRPSNGTEGDSFISHFCCNCARSDHNQPQSDDDADVGCEILGDTFMLDVDDPAYPPQWIEDESGPRCTAFIQNGEAVPTRCTQTADMFAAKEPT
jgi:hypothetical protein